MAKTLKSHISKQIKELMELDTDELISKRIERYKSIGEFDEIKE
jgi:acetyl-CoA carboxylase alpha subunit